MVKILYSVNGHGRGHSSRSEVVIEHLKDQGHDVRIVASDKATEYLGRRWEIIDIFGLAFAYKEGAVDVKSTLHKNVKGVLKKGADSYRDLHRVVKKFQPDLIISDFEPFVPRAAKNIPCVSIDHQGVLTKENVEFPAGWVKDYLVARCGALAMTPKASHYVVTSFFHAPPLDDAKGEVVQVGPILRSEVLEQKPKYEGHLLLYVTTPESGQLIDLLKDAGVPVIAYGFNRESVEKNITFKKPSVKGFLADLSSSSGVIANGGYTLISEAIFLGKPVYAFPLVNQFEQMLNAYYLQRMGLGMFDKVPDKKRLQEYIDNLPKFQKEAKKHAGNCGNEDVFSKLAEILEH